MLTKLLVNPGKFFYAVIEYLNGLQKFADDCNLHVSSDIAIILNRIITYNPKKALAASSIRHNIFKEQDAFAASCLEELQKLIKALLEKEAGIVDECSNVWRQIVSRALIKGYDKQILTACDKAETIVAIAKTDNDFAPYYTHIIGLSGVYNAKIILDTILPQLEL